VWIWVHTFIVAHRPDTIRVRTHFNETLVATPPNIIQNHSTTGYEHSTVLVVLHQPMSRPDREGRSPSECLLDDGHDVGEVVDIRMIWQSLATKDVIKLTLSSSHDFRVPGHCEEKAVQRRDCLRADKNRWFSGSTKTLTVSDIPTRGDSGGGELEG
jgi:hypothetical protein